MARDIVHGQQASRTVINISHRGASGLAPEHTFAAYDLAMETGVDYIEQDLQMTRDGVLVAMHDDTLDRTTRGPGATGPVRNKTLAEIKEFDAGQWFNEARPERANPDFAGLRVPTLEEIFQRYGQAANYYIETKNPEADPGMEEELLRLIEEYGLTAGAETRRQVLIQSFSQASLLKIHGINPRLPLIQLCSWQLSSREIQIAMDTISPYAVGIGPWKGSVDAALVGAAHRAGIDVHPYTVDDRDEMEHLISIGVDGMFTNFPGVLNAIRRSAPVLRAD
jgi:glycerophosphoryl diester phosphodiesterase